MLASSSNFLNQLLLRSASTILGEQNPDGGFCECKSIRPRKVRYLLAMLIHTLRALPNFALLFERARHSLALQRPKHDYISTHWSNYDRRWDESDLWDSWFRMLTIARIEIFFKPDAISEWGFIPFPGIGFHSRLNGI